MFFPVLGTTPDRFIMESSHPEVDINEKCCLVSSQEIGEDWVGVVRTSRTNLGRD